MKAMKAPIKLSITIKRPNGVIETSTHPKLKYISDESFAVMRAATLEAGFGECLSYEVTYETVRGMSKREMMGAGVDRTVENMSRMGE